MSSKKGVLQRPFVTVLLLFYQSGISEVERNTPYGAKRYQNINDSRDESGRAAEQIGNEVKLEDPDKTPVYAAHDQKKESDSIQYFHFLDLPFISRIPCIFKVCKSTPLTEALTHIHNRSLIVLPLFLSLFSCIKIQKISLQIANNNVYLY